MILHARIHMENWDEKYALCFWAIRIPVFQMICFSNMQVWKWLLESNESKSMKIKWNTRIQWHSIFHLNIFAQLAHKKQLHPWHARKSITSSETHLIGKRNVWTPQSCKIIVWRLPCIDKKLTLRWHKWMQPAWASFANNKYSKTHQRNWKEWKWW